MKSTSAAKGPALKSLFALFPRVTPDDTPEFEMVPADEVPDPYHGLLVHEYHMTVTVEDYHGSKVDVKILARKQTAEWYARKILLVLQSNGRVVQFGIMRIHLSACEPEVRRLIIEGRTPLGRILIEHDVLRRIEPKAFLRVIPSPAMMTWFGLDRPKPMYGRLAIIHCNGSPAVELLEIVAP